MIPPKRITEVDVLTRLILHIKPPNKYPGGDGQCQFPTLLYSSFHIIKKIQEIKQTQPDWG